MAKIKFSNQEKLDQAKRYLEISHSVEYKEQESNDLAKKYIPNVRDILITKAAEKVANNCNAYFDADAILKHSEYMNINDDEKINVTNILDIQVTMTRAEATKIQKEITELISPIDIKIELCSYLFEMIQTLNGQFFSSKSIDVSIELLCGNADTKLPDNYDEWDINFGEDDIRDNIEEDFEKLSLKEEISNKEIEEAVILSLENSPNNSEDDQQLEKTMYESYIESADVIKKQYEYFANLGYNEAAIIELIGEENYEKIQEFYS